jgi:hypothetical protein
MSNPVTSIFILLTLNASILTKAAAVNENFSKNLVLLSYLMCLHVQFSVLISDLKDKQSIQQIESQRWNSRQIGTNEDILNFISTIIVLQTLNYQISEISNLSVTETKNFIKT